MTEIRFLSNSAVVSESHTLHPHHQCGLFATTAYREGDVILVESPLYVLSSQSEDSSVAAAENISSVSTTLDTPSSLDDVPVPNCRSLFKPTSVTDTSTTTSATANDNSLAMDDLVLPPRILKQLRSTKSNSKDDDDDELRVNKLRGMILALAYYAIHPPSEETFSKLLKLYHPSTTLYNKDNQEETDAIQMAKMAVECCSLMCAPNSALSALILHDLFITRFLLIYSCNAFEGGRIYDRLSRVNHSCNPNAVVLEGYNSDPTTAATTTASSTSSLSGTIAKRDVSILKAACDIAPGEEITISYLGKYLFAGYSIRQRILRVNKHFACGCSRCSIVMNTMKCNNGDTSTSTGTRREEEEGDDDLASCIPCPICHPRSGRYLDEDVMLDEDGDEQEENGFKVCYAIPRNGLTPEERSMFCPSCKGTIRFITDGGGSMRKKKEGMAIKYMCMAEEKVYERLESTGKRYATESEQDMDSQFLQMATSICGARHWTTHFMNLHLMEETLASIHSTMMTTVTKDAEMMEDVYVEIAEAADGLDKAYKFASSLGLKLHPAHWLFDYTIALAQTLVGLGDEKSQKYGSTWIERVVEYAERFENERVQEVVIALRDAWKKADDSGDTTTISGKREAEDINGDSKRRKMG